MSDSIELRGIECFGYHGVYEEERRLGQRFVLDLVLGLDLRAASREDSLERGVDYGDVIRRARSIVEGEPRRLIESVAEKLAAELLGEFVNVIEVEVCLHKPNAPVAGAPVSDIAVRLIRSRLDLEHSEIR